MILSSCDYVRRFRIRLYSPIPGGTQLTVCGRDLRTAERRIERDYGRRHTLRGRPDGAEGSRDFVAAHNRPPDILSIVRELCRKNLVARPRPRPRLSRACLKREVRSVRYSCSPDRNEYIEVLD